MNAIELILKNALPSMLNDENLKKINDTLIETMDKFPLEAGEVRPFYMIAPGVDQPTVKIIVMNEKGEFSRELEKKSLEKIIMEIMGAGK